MKENVSSLKSVVPDTESRFSVRYITPDNARFARTEGGFASLDFEGEHYDRVMLFLVRFPFLYPFRHLL